MRSILLVVLLSAAPLAAQGDSTWTDHGRAAEAARAAHDWPAYRHHLQRAEAIIGGHPGITVGLARAAARLGDTTEAFVRLRQFAAMGLTRNLAADPDLASLTPLAAWSEVIRQVATNGQPVGVLEPVFTLADSALVPEDLVHDAARSRWLISSVRRGKVLAVGADGSVRELVPAATSGAWAMQGMALDAARGRLWVASTALPQGPAFPPADSGKAAIVSYDLASGALQRRYPLRPTDRPQAPGDLALAENGDLFAGDGRSGAVYVIRAGSDSVATLVAPGVLRSAQQPVVVGEQLLVPDYAGGIAVVNRATGVVRWLRARPGIALTGIDGMLMHDGKLIAVQNGLAPQRVVRLELDPGLTTVTACSVLAQDAALMREPTHAVVVGDYLYLIANSGWDALADDGTIVPGATLVPGRIVRLRLR